MSNQPHDPNSASKGGLSPRNPSGPLTFQEDDDRFGTASPGNQPPRRRGCLWITLILLGIGLVLTLVCCGGVLYTGKNLTGQVFLPQVNRMPEVTGKTGEVESMSVNFGETFEVAQDYPDHLVFDVQGSEGEVQLMIETGNQQEIQTAYLRDDQGEWVPLDLDAPNPPAEPPQIEVIDRQTGEPVPPSFFDRFSDADKRAQETASDARDGGSKSSPDELDPSEVPEFSLPELLPIDPEETPTSDEATESASRTE